MARTILLLHGRNYKPPQDELTELWSTVIRHGLLRDRPDAVAAFDAADLTLAYYADLSADWLATHHLQRREPVPAYDVGADLADRRASVERLMTLDAADFSRNFYARMRGAAPIFEAVADALEHPLRLLRLSERALQRYAPELAEYWADVHFGSDLRLRFQGYLQKAMAGTSNEIAVISHSLGTLIAYDAAWKLSHYGEYRRQRWNRPIDLFVTLGGPLGDSTINRRLKGATAPEPFRYPTNIRRWHNFAAEDDIIAHDEDLTNDFAAMATDLTDHHVYNPSIRRGRVNPHYAPGYLMNPALIDLLADWLIADPELRPAGGV